MPDLVKDFSKIYNKQIDDEFITESEINKYILLGIENHIKADDIFHRHSLFEELQEIAKSEMKKTFKGSLKRRYVIAHVLIELLIDKFVINNENTVLDTFYTKLDNIDINNANKFFEKINIQENTSHFKRNFTKFIRLKFLFRLKENEGIIFTLDKVFSKKLNYNFMEEQKKWDLTINNIYKKIEKQIPLLLGDVKTKLYE